MELEELKQKWSLLSERLERTEVIHRQQMVAVLHLRLGSYLRYTRFIALFNVACVPVCVAIGHYRGVSSSVIIAAILVFLVLFLPSLWGVWLLEKASDCGCDMVECERGITRYAVFMLRYRIGAYLAAMLMLGGLAVWAADYYTLQDMWWTVAAVYATVAVIFAADYWYDRDRTRELQQRLRDLRAFSEE